VNSSDDTSLRARRRVALRILPFVYLIYIVNYMDRVNVSFANLRMSADLSFSDRVYGLGVGIFYLSYVLFEIPGALIVERWSARKWIARIMISWGIVTVLTGFVRTTQQFYLARFFLGLAEASFFPGMIVYLTHWFTQRDRGRAIACLYTAVPTAALVGAPIAGWLLGVQWPWLTGWRWLFIVEGIPAIVMGCVTLFYLTDRPSQARWLRQDERDWLETELRSELEAKKQIRNPTISEAFRDRRILLLIAAWFLALSGLLGSVYWIPTFVKRLSGLPDRTVTTLLIFPALIGVCGTLINGWHSDKTGERRWHTAFPLLAAGLLYAMSIPTHNEPVLVLVFLLLGSGAFYACQPIFWSIPTTILGESAAAASFGLINSVGQLGGLSGPYLIGLLNEKTHTLTASLGFVALAYIGAGGLVASLKVGDRQIRRGS
jgi:MFS transporter, ACS family, tartrate transporter